MKKVVVVGVDAGCWDMLKLGIAEGKLPTFQRLIKEGVSGELKSTVPYVTWPAWTSAITGVNPGKHNIFNFVTFENYKYRILTAADRKCDPIWKILSRKGLKVGVLYVPVTYPPDRDIDGFMVSGNGVLSIDSDFTYPSELKERLLSRGYELDVEEDDTKQLDLASMLDAEEVRERIALELMRDIQWDFYMVVFMSTDRAQHKRWKYLDRSASGYDLPKAETGKNEILKAYSSLDEFLNETLRLVGGTADIIILSDHGFGSTHKAFYVNSWLRSQGYLVIRKPPKGSMLFRLGLSRRNIGSLMHLLGGVMPLTVRKKLRKHRVIRDARKHFPSYTIDFDNTKAWFYKECCIKINLKGREPRGIVDESQYEIIRDDLIHKLLELTDPETGERILISAYKREKIYHGNYVGNAADIVFLLRDGYRADLELVADKLVEHQSQSFHTPYGIFIAHGPSIKSDEKIGGIDIVDIAPTVLHIFGVPIPDYIDGRVLMEIFKEDSDEAQRKPSRTRYGERERIRERISHLKAQAKSKNKL